MVTPDPAFCSRLKHSEAVSAALLRINNMISAGLEQRLARFHPSLITFVPSSAGIKLLLTDVIRSRCTDVAVLCGVREASTPAGCSNGRGTRRWSSGPGRSPLLAARTSDRNTPLASAVFISGISVSVCLILINLHF